MNRYLVGILVRDVLHRVEYREVNVIEAADIKEAENKYCFQNFVHPNDKCEAMAVFKKRDEGPKLFVNPSYVKQEWLDMLIPPGWKTRSEEQDDMWSLIEKVGQYMKQYPNQKLIITGESAELMEVLKTK